MEIKLKAGKKYKICSCGLSKSLPFCDNGHREFNAANGMLVYPNPAEDVMNVSLVEKTNDPAYVSLIVC